MPALSAEQHQKTSRRPGFMDAVFVTFLSSNQKGSPSLSRVELYLFLLKQAELVASIERSNFVALCR